MQQAIIQLRQIKVRKNVIRTTALRPTEEHYNFALWIVKARRPTLSKLRC